MAGSAHSSMPTERQGLTVEDAIVGRQSVRAYLDKPVSRELVARILETAGRAPSGSNIQPWRVWVIDGEAKRRIAAELTAAYNAGVPEAREYNYYPVKWREPYQGRRRACGWGLYNTMGITRDDKEGMHRQRAQNYDFFGALANYAKILEKRLGIPADQMVVCGIALGFPDAAAKVNSFRTEREPLEKFVHWVDELQS